MKGFEKVVKYVVLGEVTSPPRKRHENVTTSMNRHAEARQLGSINRRQRFVEGARGLMSP